MKYHRIQCIALILLMIFNFTACGGGTKEIGSTPVQSDDLTTAVSSDGQWMGSGGCYTLDRLNECEYFMLRGDAEHLIFSDMEHLVDREGNILFDQYMRDFVVVADGIWCAVEKGMVGDEYIQECDFMKLGFDGQELLRLDLSVRADSFVITETNIVIYDSMNQKMMVYGIDGSKQGNVDCSTAALEEFSGRILSGGDSSLWLFNQTDTELSLYPINLSTMNLGTAVALPEEMEALAKGTTEHPFLIATKSEFSYLDPVTGTMSNILFWEECGISEQELRYFIPDGDGFLCLSVTGLARIRPAKPEEIHPKTRLILAALSPYEGTNLAAMFNAANDDYYVEVVDYSNGNELSREDALTKLNTELTSQNGPDMVMVSDVSSLQNSSAFADLYPLLDEDAELNRDDFYGLEAIENSGKLMLAPVYLSITTFGVLKEVGGDRMGWTWDEYFEMESQLPPDGVMSSFLGADFFLQTSLNLYAPHAIDWVNGTCNFDTPEFVRILEAAKKGYDPNCPEENPYFLDEVNAMMSDGRMIMVETGFSDVESFAWSEKYSGRELSYIGWPTPDGSCGSVFYVSGVSVYAGTDCMEGCWEFTKYALKSTYAYKPTFENAIAEATEPKETDDGEQKPMLTQTQADTYRKLMESITVAVSDSNEVNRIVLEEAGAMFAGDKTPEETARIIQSRMSIYVSEHK